MTNFDSVPSKTLHMTNKRYVDAMNAALRECTQAEILSLTEFAKEQDQWRRQDFRFGGLKLKNLPFCPSSL